VHSNIIHSIKNLEVIGVEALSNLALVSKLMGASDEAIHVLQKLNKLIPKSPEVVFWHNFGCLDRV
jgi:hypothetical protein